jgi:hypothetical protein
MFSTLDIQDSCFLPGTKLPSRKAWLQSNLAWVSRVLSTSAVSVPTSPGLATPGVGGDRWSGCHILVVGLSSGRRSEAPTGYHPGYAGHRLWVYLCVYVAGAAEQSASTARLPTLHPTPQTPHPEAEFRLSSRFLGLVYK